jgi:hypothetical protein
MPKSIKQLREMADELGREAGNAAASWYYDRCDQLTREDYIKVLRGIRDCDPLIMDTFVSGSLSGEYADDMTPKRLYEDLEMGDNAIELVGDEICDAYETAFNRAYQDSVERETMERLRTNYVFHIELELIEQKPDEIMSIMLDAALKQNVSLVEESIAEDGEVIA